MTHVAVIIGSTRQGRFGDKPARWIAERLGERPDITVEILDLRDFPLPFFDDALAPARRAGLPQSDSAMAAWTEAIDRADAFVIITAEYNHGYTAVLKNALDHLYREWNRKPVAFVGYGNAGGARAIEQLRAVAIELEMAPIKRALAVPMEALMKYFMEQSDDLDFSAGDDAAEAMIDELLWWAGALAAARETALAA
jgi:NAD(P)H-dependent FMN reductase